MLNLNSQYPENCRLSIELDKFQEEVGLFENNSSIFKKESHLEQSRRKEDYLNQIIGRAPFEDRKRFLLLQLNLKKLTEEFTCMKEFERIKQCMLTLRITRNRLTSQKRGNEMLRQQFQQNLDELQLLANKYSVQTLNDAKQRKFINEALNMLNNMQQFVYKELNDFPDDIIDLSMEQEAPIQQMSQNSVRLQQNMCLWDRITQFILGPCSCSCNNESRDVSFVRSKDLPINRSNGV